MRFPGALDEAVENWLEGRRQSVAQASAALSDRYRRGQTSGGADLAAYLTVRLPATFAVNNRVLSEVAALRPDFAPASIADIGAGPGTAGWAALATWDSITAVEQVEATPAFGALLHDLNAASGLPALVNAGVRDETLIQWNAAPKDLVIASYVLAEMAETAIDAAVKKLWLAAASMLVLIEPGTPDGFRRIRIARDALRKAGAVIVAPCTHDGACPMTGGDWCHFKARVQRSRAHMHAKGATVPFEDEPFSYLAVARDGAASAGARVLSPTVISKAGAELKLCTGAGVSRQTVAVRDKAVFKRAKKLGWGDLWTADKASV